MGQRRARAAYGIAVRDHFPTSSSTPTSSCSRRRHVHGGKLDEEACCATRSRARARPRRRRRPGPRAETLETLAAEHTEMVDEHAVFGVPTFIEGDQAVSSVHEPAHADDVARCSTPPWTSLNEFKRTKIPR
jgi:hypothetical protein